MWLKQSTSTSFLVGPVLDASGLPVTTAGTSDFRISKAGTTAIFSGGTATHDTNGNYKITLTTGNTDTIGSLEIGMHNTSYAMSVHRFMVIEPTIFDDLVSTATNASGGLRDVARINGQTVSAAAPVTFPASVADETTVASRASQASVNAIPTNPLLTNDVRLNYLDFSISTLNTNVLNLNNLSAKMNVFGAPLLEIPESGSTVYAFTLVVKDDEDKLVALDALPTVTAANAAGTNRSGNLSAVSNPATGRYTFTYTVANTHAAESLRISISGAVSSEARYVEWVGAVVNYDSLTVLQSLQSTVNGINTKIPYTMNLDTSGRVLLQPTHHPGVSIDNVTVVDELGVNGLASNALDSDIARLVWNQLVSDNWDNNSFGKRGVISTNSTREIAITGSGHVASVLHSSEPNSIAETSFVSGAVSARVIAADAIDADAMAASANTEIANAVAATQVLSRLDSMIESNGAGQFRFDTIAVSMVAGGGGAVNISVEDRSITVV